MQMLKARPLVTKEWKRCNIPEMSYFCFGILTDWVSVSDRTNEAITFKSTSIPGFSQTPRVSVKCSPTD